MKRTTIRSDREYDAALRRISALLNAEAGSEEEQELRQLAGAVERYEKIAYPAEQPDPVEVIKFYLDQKGLTRADLEPYLGAASRVSEVLSGKRELSKAMIRNLTLGLGIPSDLLLGINPARVYEVREGGASAPYRAPDPARLKTANKQGGRRRKAGK